MCVAARCVTNTLMGDIPVGNGYLATGRALASSGAVLCTRLANLAATDDEAYLRAVSLGLVGFWACGYFMEGSPSGSEPCARPHPYPVRATRSLARFRPAPQS